MADSNGYELQTISTRISFIKNTFREQKPSEKRFNVHSYRTNTGYRARASYHSEELSCLFSISLSSIVNGVPQSRRLFYTRLVEWGTCRIRESELAPRKENRDKISIRRKCIE